MYISKNDKLSTKDSHRFLNFAQLVAKQNLNRTLIAEIFAKELKFLRTTQPSENIALYPEETEFSEDSPKSPDVEATSVPKWLPTDEIGTYRLPINCQGSWYNGCMVNSFLVAIFASFDAAGVEVKEVGGSPFFQLLFESRTFMSLRTYGRMWRIWVPNGYNNAGTMQDSIIKPLCEADDDALSQLFLSGVLFSATCSNRTMCPAKEGLGIWKHAAQLPRVMFFPALQLTIQDLMLIRSMLSGKVCTQTIAGEQNGILTGYCKGLYESENGDSYATCRGQVKCTLKLRELF